MSETPANTQPVSPHVGAAPRPAHGSVLTGIALMLVFAMIAPGIDVFAKLAAQHQPPGQVAAARFVVQFLLLLPVMIHRKSFTSLAPSLLALHLVRGVLIGVATICFITALRSMPIADAIATFFVEPMILTILGGLVLGEQVGWRRYVACAVGFAGAMIVVQPSFDVLGWVATLPLVAALCFALYLVLTRHLAAREDPLSMQGFTGLFGALFVGAVLWAADGSGSSVFDPFWPDMRGWLLILGAGIFATVSHLFLVFAFRNAPASVLAPLQYIEIVAATVLGYLVFGDFPDAGKWLGIAIIVSSGLFIIWRERVAGQKGA